RPVLVRPIRARPAAPGVWHAHKADRNPMPSTKLIGARRQYLDLARPHPGAEHGQLAVAGIGALAGQRVELPLVVRAGQRAPVKVALAELETQVVAGVLDGPDLAPG